MTVKSAILGLTFQLVMQTVGLPNEPTATHYRLWKLAPVAGEVGMLVFLVSLYRRQGSTS